MVTRQDQSKGLPEGWVRRLPTDVTWSDLVVREPVRRKLQELAKHAADPLLGSTREPRVSAGASALFTGDPGTGRTLGARVLAAQLGRDLWQVDLGRVVSKYIAETEKNLHRLFDAAGEGGIVLLFDEADALFGRRSEVKDSHDRYANLEIGHLLQRIEAYAGLVILATNHRRTIDPAVLRRLSAVIHFDRPAKAP
jgi:SpoVK/Ycf46/Vps4 family AAA+-type ATPase